VGVFVIKILQTIPHQVEKYIKKEPKNALKRGESLSNEN
jgi:hypothetical protein